MMVHAAERDGARTDRGPDQLVFFGDAVVAIAITLLVLPLMVSSLCLSTMRWRVQRTPALQRTNDDLRAVDGLRNSALFVVAFAVVMIVPGAGLWPMFVLAFDDPLGWWMNRRRARMLARRRLRTSRRTSRRGGPAAGPAPGE